MGDWDELMRLSARLRAKRRATSQHVRTVLLDLCRGRYLAVDDLVRLTGRSARTLRGHHLARMQTTGELALRYRDRPTHPQQAYTTVEDNPDTANNEEKDDD